MGFCVDESKKEEAGRIGIAVKRTEKKDKEIEVGGWGEKLRWVLRIMWC